MLTATLDPFNQLAPRRYPVAPAERPQRPFLAVTGLLAERQREHPKVRAYELLSLRTEPVVLVLDIPFETGLEFLAEPEAMRALPRPPSILATEPPVVRARPSERLRPEPGALPFVMAVRSLIEAERLIEAREMLNAAPTRILTDPLVTRLRSVLAPPVVKRVERRDVDRNREYEWLRAHGHQYRGRWVALDGDRMIASAPTLRELQEQLRAMALPNPPLLHRVD
jgi:hypothetical protein